MERYGYGLLGKWIRYWLYDTFMRLKKRYPRKQLKLDITPACSNENSFKCAYGDVNGNVK